MKAYPIQMGVSKGDIMIAQIDNESGQEKVITISPDQVEQVVSALRIAVEEIRKHSNPLMEDGRSA
jgi:hypothetical protein